MLGSLAYKPLPYILKEVHEEYKSGELILKSKNEHRQIYFLKGNIAHISSSLETDRIGLFLVKQNLINEEKLKEALGLYKEGQLFGEFLVSMDIISEEVLKESLKNYQAYLLSKILFWNDGAYIFIEKEVKEEKKFLDISFANLMVKAARFINNEVLLRKFFGEERHFIAFSSSPYKLLQTLSLDNEEYFILSRIPKILSLQELLGICSNLKLKVLQIIFALYISGVIEMLTRQEALERRMEESQISSEALNVILETREKFEKKIPEKIRIRRDFIRDLKERAKDGDLYKLFNLSPGSTIQDIYQRYLEYMKLVHPDNAFIEGLKDLKEDMIELSEILTRAYQTLCTPHKRAIYDEVYVKNKSKSKEEMQRKILQKEIAHKNYIKAKEYIDREDYHSAMQLLEEAHRFDPENSEILLALVNVEVKNPNWIKRATDRLVEYLNEKPDFEDGWLVLATIYLSRGMVQKAKMCVKKVMEMNENNEKAKILLYELQKKEIK